MGKDIQLRILNNLTFGDTIELNDGQKLTIKQVQND